MGNKNADGMQEEVLSKRESSHRPIRIHTNTCTRTGVFKHYEIFGSLLSLHQRNTGIQGKNSFPFPMLWCVRLRTVSWTHQLGTKRV